MPTYKHGDKWRTTATFNYKQKTKVTRTKREGEIWEAEILREMSKSEDELREAVTFKHVLERYRDEVTPKKRGNHWEFIRIQAFLKSTLPINKPLAKVTSDDLGLWRDERAKEVSAGTILRDFNLLSSIFSQAKKEWKYITDNPVSDVRKPREPDHRDIVISRQHIRAMIKALGYKHTGPIKSVSQAIAMCFLVALRTGMRAGELTGLTWDRVKSDYCILPVTKTKPRNVPLTHKAMRLIERMRGFDDDLVFGIKPQTLDALFRKVRDKAGLKESFTFHDSRHTAATWLAKQVDVLTLCKIFGWKNTSQALTYYNPTASDIAKMLNKRK
jgi:integrase